ncbi:hypothetical protein GALL_541090 [mine drainage metagenome]|uniref:Uncharacterized protein n=1 Tax=mine drainage metagenome TaxID=410659 RepID=A0A1J5PA31_9ZZZZ
MITLLLDEFNTYCKFVRIARNCSEIALLEFLWTTTVLSNSLL